MLMTAHTFNNGKTITDPCLLRSFSILEKSSDKETKIKTTFGFYGIYVDDIIVCLVRDGDLYVKSAPNLSAFSSLDGGFLKIHRHDRDMTTQFIKISHDEIDTADKLTNVILLAKKNATDEKNKASNVDKRLRDLPNMKHRTECILNKVGIMSVSELEEVGAAAAFFKINAMNGGLKKDMMYILEGAITGKHWRLISSERKTELDDELNLAANRH